MMPAALNPAPSRARPGNGLSSNPVLNGAWRTPLVSNTSTAVANQGQSAESLLIVTKARGTEAHKGGQVVLKGSPGDNCIAGWLRGDPPAMVASACKTAIGGL